MTAATTKFRYLNDPSYRESCRLARDNHRARLKAIKLLSQPLVSPDLALDHSPEKNDGDSLYWRTFELAHCLAWARSLDDEEQHLGARALERLKEIAA